MELLIAVGIVSVLAALLVPAIRKMKDSGDSVQCLSNLRAMGLFSMNYSLDNDGRMVQSYVGGPATYWFDTYCIYYGYNHPDVRRNLPPAITCKANRRIGTGWGGVNGGKQWAINWGTGYSSTPSNPPKPEEAHRWVKLGQIQQYPSESIVPLATPSKTAWFVDGGEFSFFYQSASQSDPFRRPHNGKSNVLYFDGHAATVDIPDFTKVSPSILKKQEWVDFFGHKSD